ncbi:MAG TPA: divalent-cation tolerance protein CutA [Thermoanaerobaculia bacterium]|jgi:periplasmic divalent cation tolerance protein|nr:divalent-cation tolerance protein CutA [Thermoanaerobaculia bacterium]MDI9631151.1 divalent-cation tolerance protein CutA [Acidobacteriota bacterium]MBP7812412.1 divalent-cation tolerance protein CutA [Thermoanaerobaculia bacterium]MBP8844418.1 divalent-cation tolerance protein CutA [Thermoanaerobaculia bacterium]HNU81831.1 divalent-cation tolerance protein CutA [Thermoanaerobaculia bacterium]
MEALAVLTTVGNEEQANTIARELVARRHAACVNIVVGVRSVYRWKGKICKDSEYLLLAKTTVAEYPAVVETIRELHTYELPEILALRVDLATDDFLAWIAASLDKDAAFVDDDVDEGVTIPLDDTNF